MWELKMLWLFLGLLRLSAGSEEVAGPGACPLYDLPVPEGSSGCLEINITEKSPVLCKMQSSVTATDRSNCTPFMVLANKDTPWYFNSMFKGRMNLTTQGVTVKQAEKWMAGEYQIITSLHGTCLARINLTVPGPGPCPLYDLSVPEGSSGSVRINITEESSCLCKTQSAVAATDRSDCTPLMVLASKESLRYLNGTFKGRMNLTTQGVTVKKAEKWLAGQYRVETSLHGTCLARINLTVPDPIAEFPAARGEMVNLTGEGSSNRILTNSSSAWEPRRHYGVWVSLGFVAVLFTAAGLYVFWKRRGEGLETCNPGEEGFSGLPVSMLAGIS